VRPDAVVHARARDQDHAGRLVEAGATEVIQEALEGSLRIAGRLLEDIGFPEETVERRLGEARSVAGGSDLS